MYKMTFPVEIHSTRCLVEADIIPGKLPLLVSKKALKKMGAIINMENDTLNAFDWKNSVKLANTKSGHYAVVITWKSGGKWFSDGQLNQALATVRSNGGTVSVRTCPIAQELCSSIGG